MLIVRQEDHDIVYQVDTYFEPDAVSHVLAAMRSGKYADKTRVSRFDRQKERLSILRNEAIFHFDAALLAYRWELNDIFEKAREAILKRINIYVDADTYCSVMTDIHENGLLPAFKPAIMAQFGAMPRNEFWAALQRDRYAILDMSPPLRPIILRYIWESGEIFADEVNGMKVHLIAQKMSNLNTVHIGVSETQL